MAFEAGAERRLRNLPPRGTKHALFSPCSSPDANGTSTSTYGYEDIIPSMRDRACLPRNPGICKVPVHVA